MGQSSEKERGEVFFFRVSVWRVRPIEFTTRTEEGSAGRNGGPKRGSPLQNKKELLRKLN